MPSCSFCSEVLKKDQCQASPQDSSRCAECLSRNRSGCDILGPTPEQLRTIGRQFQKFEAEVRAVEEERRALDNRLERLRKQKDLWLERRLRAFSRGLDTVEELERVEREEAEQAVAQAAAAPPSVPEPDFPPLSPGWMESGVNPDLDLLALLQPGPSGDTPLGEPLHSPGGAGSSRDT
ncbi:hypothetical protein RB596_007918 [Gaeumannomyces avenae]